VEREGWRRDGVERTSPPADAGILCLFAKHRPTALLASFSLSLR